MKVREKTVRLNVIPFVDGGKLTGSETSAYGKGERPCLSGSIAVRANNKRNAAANSSHTVRRVARKNLKPTIAASTSAPRFKNQAR